MKEEESVQEFHSRLLELSNQMIALGESMPDARLVDKPVRSLRKRFEAKVMAIEEHKDTDTMRLDELIGSLRTYEINDGFLKNDNLKGVALKIEKSKPISSKKEKSKVVVDVRKTRDGTISFEKSNEK